MKAININGERLMGLVHMDEPVPAADEVIVRLEYVGFCGSDLNTYLGRNPLVKLPVIPGHEIGAVVEKVGEAVPDIIRPGMTVTVNPYTACGKCPSCRNGRANACQFNETLGVQRNGAMREKMALPWTKIIPAEGLDARTCALVEPMSVGFHAAARGAVCDIDTVMVIGCGMVGLGAVVRSVLRGATVIAADVDDEKLALARQMGAAHTINTMTEDVHARLQEITSGTGPDVIIEAVGNPFTYRMAVDEVAFTGRVVCIGYANTEVSFQTKYFVQKELDIRGSRNAMPEDFRAVIKYMQRGECPVGKLVSMTVSPDEAKDAMDRWAEAPGKVFRILLRF